MTPLQQIETALAELCLIGGTFAHGAAGITFVVNGKRVYLSYALLKISNAAAVKRAIAHQVGERVG